jgi:epsilon-lactone hydrolase
VPDPVDVAAPLTRADRVAARLSSWVLRPALSGRVPLALPRVGGDVLGRLRPLPAGTSIRRGAVAGVRAELVRHETSDPDHVVVFLHGGGYTIGSPAAYRGFTATLARCAGAEVVAPDYRLAPEHPYPAALDDAVAVYRAVVERAPTRITIAGDSAGGGLALALALAARDRGLRPADALGLVSPWLDLTLDAPALDVHDDPLLTSSGFRFGASSYAGDRRDEPYVSPLFADLSDLPPVLVQYAGGEALEQDALRVVRRVHDAGGSVDLHRFDGFWHVHHLLAGLLRSADDAVADLAAFLATASR